MKKAQWENVYIFISSTFNDMHAERDYLIKRVFPELRLWCAKRRLKLIDIDLRWGVSEEDATKNKRVVDVCLRNIDKCRPFFLCFLGQRRGWIPQASDINPETMAMYPKITEYLGKHSITELEILHAIMHPLHHESKTSHAFFYFRDSDYLKSIDHKDIRDLYCPCESDPDFEAFKLNIRNHFDVKNYHGQWNQKKTSNELVNVQGKDLSSGRLEHFTVEDESLKDSLLKSLKTAISLEFPDHDDIKEIQSPKDQELFDQDTFLFQACDSYIPRPVEEKKVLDYVHGNARVPFVLCAHAGSGKTSLLAHLISENQLRGKVFYRFAGISIDSSNAQRTLALLAEQMMDEQVIEEKDVLSAMDNIVLNFPSLLSKIKEDVTIVIDALDQWDKAFEELYWLPAELNDHVRLVVSVRTDAEKQLMDLLQRHRLMLCELAPMDSIEEKRQFMKQYMSQYLKEFTDEQMDLILPMEGTNNPLYLKIVLNELRIHGSFDTLIEQLKRYYGKTPVHAFTRVIERLEQEDYSTGIENSVLTCVFLGVLAYSLDGMDFPDYITIYQNLNPNYEKEEIMDGIYEIARHLSPYLVIDGQHVDYLYDSFKKAVKLRYQQLESKFHMMLIQKIVMSYEDGFEVHDKSPQMRKDALHLLHHGLLHSEEAFNALIQDASFFVAALVNLGTSIIADMMMEADQRGYQSPDYKEIAYALRSARIMIDTNPNCVFYELNCRTHNAVTQTLLEQSEQMDLLYFEPLEQIREKISPVRTMSLLKSDSDCNVHVLDKVIVYVTNKVLWRKEHSVNSVIYVQNIETEKIESVLHLPYPVRRSSADGNYVYVLSSVFSESEDFCMEIFELPTLRKVMSKQMKQKIRPGMKLLGYCHGYCGVMYDVARSDELPHRLAVIRINDGECLAEMNYPVETTTFMSDGRISNAGLDLSFYGPFLLEEFSDHSVSRCWHLPSKTCVEDHDYKAFSAGGVMDGSMFYFYQKLDDQILCTRYKLDKDSIVDKKKASWTKYSGSFSMNAGAAAGYFFLEEGAETLRMYDSELNLIGYLEGIFQFSNGLDNNNIYGVQDYLVLSQASSLLFYKMDDLLSLCTIERPEASDEKGTSIYDSFIYRNRLYLIGNTAKIIDLDSFMTIVDVPVKGYASFESVLGTGNLPANVYHVHGSDYFVQYRVYSYRDMEYEFILYRLRDFSSAARCYRQFDGKKVETVFCDELNLGVVVCENKPYEAEVHLISLRDLETKSIWKMDTAYTFMKVVTLDQKKSYLICFKCPVDDEHQALNIYDPIDQKLEISYVMDKQMIVHTYPVLLRGHRVILYGFDQKKLEYFFLVYNFDEKTMMHVPFLKVEDDHQGIQIKGYNKDEIFIYHNSSKKIYWFDLDSFDLRLSIDISASPGCSHVMHKYGAILNFKGDGVMDVYDDETGDYLMSQAFPAENPDLLDIEDSEVFFRGQSMKKTYFYQLTSTQK